jgi:hypothetical protein
MDSKKESFAAGDDVYDSHGNLASYVARDYDGHIIRYVYDSEDGEGPSRLSDPLVVRVVFDSPPTIQKNAEINKLNEEISAKQQQIKELNASAKYASDECLRLTDKLSKIDSLRYIEDFLDGKMTHFVIVTNSGKFEIQEKNIAIASEDRHVRETKLLTLFGNKDSKYFHWRLNRYSDGSGDYTTAYPCKSYDEALAYAQDLLIKELEKLDTNSLPWWLNNLMESAQKFDVPIPEKISVTIKMRKLEYALQAKTKALNDLMAADKTIKELA